MTRQIINVGTGPDTKDGDTVRQAFIKVNENFEEVYGAIELLGGGDIGSQIIPTSIKGSVYDNNNNIVIDAVTGKLTLNAVDHFIPLKYEFRANFGQNGSLVDLENLPPGWSYTKLNNKATVTHTVASRYPSTISYWGYSVTQGLRLRFPTAGYQVTRDPNILNSFTLDLNSAVVGADNGQYALVTVIF